MIDYENSTNNKINKIDSSVTNTNESKKDFFFIGIQAN
jgi:hypothetical protein